MASVSLHNVDRLFDALGIRSAVQLQPAVVDGEPRQNDAVHAWSCGYVGRRLEGLGWAVQHEVEVGSGRFRGWIDTLAYRPFDRALLTSEVKAAMPDIGELQRATTRYERDAWHAARRFGWRPAHQIVAVLALDSLEIDERIRVNRDLLAAAYPGRASALAAWIEGSGPPPPSRCLALIDPAWRGRRWLRPTRVDGRRTAPRYAGYRDALERIRG
jgi:hypothetical protein